MSIYIVRGGNKGIQFADTPVLLYTADIVGLVNTLRITEAF